MKVYDALGIEKKNVGPAGATGAQGPIGPPGSKGDAGDTGRPGPPGQPGAAGSTGAQGPTGPPIYLVRRGDDGVRGPPGVTGPLGTASNITPDTHPTTPTIYDDEFEFGTTLDTAGARRVGASAWSALNTPGTSQYLVSAGQFDMRYINATLTKALCAVGQAVPAGAWAFACKLQDVGQPILAASAIGAAVTGGIGVYNSGNTHIDGIGWQVNGTADGNQQFIVQEQATSFTTPATPNFQSVMSSTPPWFPIIPRYLAVSYDGTSTLTFSISWNGLVYQPMWSHTVASFLSAMTHIVLFGGNTDVIGSTNPQLDFIFDWFRRTA